jgi:hypothetical protein
MSTTSRITNIASVTKNLKPRQSSLNRPKRPPRENRMSGKKNKN